MDAEQVVIELRNTAGWYEKMGVDRLQRDMMHKAADLIERLEVGLVNAEVHSDCMESRMTAAVAILRTIDWVGSGAKGRIQDAIELLTPPATDQTTAEGGSNGQ